MAPKADMWEMEMPSKVKRRGDAVVFTALNISRKGRKCSLRDCLWRHSGKFRKIN